MIRQLLQDSEDRTSGDKELKAIWVEHAKNLEKTDPVAWARVRWIVEKYDGNNITNGLEIFLAYALREGYRPPDAYFEKTKQGALGRFIPGELVKDLLENEHFLVIGDEGERGPLWYAQDGYYHSKGDMHLRQKIEEILGSMARLVNRSQRIEVVDQIRNASILWQKDLVDNLEEIPVHNGVLDSKTRTLRPYDLTRDHFFMQLPATFDPEAKCPRIDGFLDTIVPRDTKQALLDVVAQALLRIPMKDHLAAIGPPDSGKTTFAEVVRRFLGEENVSAIPLQSLVHDRFAPSGLRNKLLNIYDDLGTKRLSDVAAFNAQTGGGRVRHERKFCDAADFTPYAKHLFFANKLPRLESNLTELGDDVLAFFRRLHVEHFPFLFKDDPEPGTTQRKREDRGMLLAEMTSAQEMSGFLNLLLEALPHVIKHGPRWTKSSNESMIAYFRASNSFQAFLSELCPRTPGKMTSKDTLKECYYWYCDERGLEVVKDRTIHDCLANYGALAYQDPPTAQPRRRWWRGITIDLQKLDEAGCAGADMSAKVKSGMRDDSRDEITTLSTQTSITTITSITTSAQPRGRGEETEIRTTVKENAVIPEFACDSVAATPPDQKEAGP
jgi:P4 family phage/plasmid primase-like protien